MQREGRIVGITLYKNDVLVRREGEAPNTEGASRGEVREFSRHSRQRLAFVASNTSVTFRTMITLTYPSEFPTDGREVKRHLLAFRKWLTRDVGPYQNLWFLEFQKRGAPHVHLLIDTPMPTRRDAIKALRWRVAASWYRIVASGDPKHLGAGTRTERLRSTEGGKRYAVKYAQKMKQKAVPEAYRNCGRFWGHSAGVRPVPGRAYRCTEDDLRGALEGWEYAPPDDRVVWKVLYNQADWFGQYIDGTVDNHSEKVYTAAEQQLPQAPPKSTKGE